MHTVYRSIVDALASPVQGCHLYEVTCPLEGTAYIWAKQPVFAKAAAMLSWGAIVEQDQAGEIMDLLDEL